MKNETAPQGQAWCSAHQTYHETSEFYKHSRSFNGLYYQCKEANKRERKSVYKRAIDCWRNIQSRCKNKDGKSPTYWDVECRMTKEEFMDWYMLECDKFLQKTPEGKPTVDRLEKHYEIGKIRIIDHKTNSLLTNRNKNLVAPEGMAWCGYHKEYHSRELFSIKKRSHHGLDYMCKDARKIVRKKGS